MGIHDYPANVYFQKMLPMLLDNTVTKKLNILTIYSMKIKINVDGHKKKAKELERSLNRLLPIQKVKMLVWKQNMVGI